MSLEHLYYCFPGGRHKAITLSYDDGKIEDRRLVEIFNRFGLKGSFNLNGAKFGREHRIEASEVAELYAGHEIAAHSLTHPTLTRCPREMLVQQIVDDRRRLEDLAGYAVRGFAYPNGQHHEALRRLLPELGIAYARTTTPTRKFLMQDDGIQWHPSCHHNEELLDLTEEFLARQKSQYLDVLSVWGHSFDYERDGNWHIIEDFGRLAGGQADIWYATYLQIVDYLAAADRLIFTMDCTKVHNPSASSVWLSIHQRIEDKLEQSLIEVAGGASLVLA